MIIRAKRIFPITSAVIFDGTNAEEVLTLTDTNYRDLKGRLHADIGQYSKEEYIGVANTTGRVWFIFDGILYQAVTNNVICIEGNDLYVFRSAEEFSHIFERITE